MCVCVRVRFECHRVRSKGRVGVHASCVRTCIVQELVVRRRMSPPTTSGEVMLAEEHPTVKAWLDKNAKRSYKAKGKDC